MTPVSDEWFIRLPDGRVVRAATTSAVRHHFHAGHIPLNSRVRRSAEEEWTALEWTQEFADLTPVPPRPDGQAAAPKDRLRPVVMSSEPGGVASRLDPLRLHTLGIRGISDELLAALDSTFVRAKLLVAGVTCMVGSLLVLLAAAIAGRAGEPWQWIPYLGGVLGVSLAAAIGNSLLTQLTYIELSRLRPARLGEALVGLPKFVFRLTVLYFLAIACTLTLIFLLRKAPGWVEGLGPDRLPGLALELARNSAGVAGLLLEVLLWLLLTFAWLLAPVAIVEEGRLFGVIGQWLRLVRQHLGRLLLYEALAAGLGLVTALPFLAPLGLAALGYRTPAWQPRLDDPIGLALLFLAGAAITPLVAYLSVANVFIYLNLRYEYTPPK